MTETVYYDEIGLSYSKLLQDVKDFLALLKHYKIITDGMSSANVSYHFIFSFLTIPFCYFFFKRIIFYLCFVLGFNFRTNGTGL